MAIRRNPPPQGHGKVRLRIQEPDRLVLETAGEGGIAVVRRAFLPAWKARLENGTALATLAVDGLLLGAAVPAGSHRVELRVSGWPEEAAAAVALAATILALGIATRSLRLAIRRRLTARAEGPGPM